MYDDAGNVVEETAGSLSLFKPSNWLAKVEFINHLIALNNVLIAVMASAKGGKSSFIQLLCQHVNANVSTHVFKASSAFTSADLVEQLAVITHPKTEKKPSFSKIIASINKQKMHHLIIIDEAEHLSSDCLHDILTAIKEADGVPYFHFCLVSDYELASSLTTLESTHFPNLIHSIELGPLTFAETMTYLSVYLRGLPRTPTRAQREALYRQTGGHLALINEQINDLLVKNTKNKIVTKKNTKQWLSMVVCTILVSSISIYFVYHKKDISSSFSETEAQFNLISDIPSLTMAHKESIMPVITRGKEEIEEEKEEAIANNEEISLSRSMYRQHSKRIKLPSFIASIPSLMEKKTLRTSSQVAHLDKALPLSTKGITPLSTTGMAKTNAHPFTIQLIASKRHADIQRFITKHSLSNKVNVGVSKRQDGNWFVLTMGSYYTAEKARLAIKNLPKELADLHPWVRKKLGLKQLG